MESEIGNQPVNTPAKFNAANKNHLGLEMTDISHYPAPLRAAMEEESNFYVRGTNGETMHLEAEEAWAHFFGENGYRISWIIGDTEFVLRRSEDEQRSTVTLFL